MFLENVFQNFVKSLSTANILHFFVQEIYDLCSRVKILPCGMFEF